MSLKRIGTARISQGTPQRLRRLALCLFRRRAGNDEPYCVRQGAGGPHYVCLKNATTRNPHHRNVRLFDDCDRTDTAPIAPGESFYEFLNRSAVDEPGRSRDLSERWFADYVDDAAASELNRFVSDFRSKDDTQHHAAWLELCVHQMLVRLGFSVDIHPDVPGTPKHPDFGATSDGSRILAEATIVKPDSDPRALQPNEEDALRKFAKLEIRDQIVVIEGSAEHCVNL